MKCIEYLGDSKKQLDKFPEKTRAAAALQFKRLRLGKQPNKFKPMNTIGTGVKEIRLKDKDGIFRIIYTANFADKIYILHSFKKTTQKTEQKDIDLAKRRFRSIPE